MKKNKSQNPLQGPATPIYDVEGEERLTAKFSKSTFDLLKMAYKPFQKRIIFGLLLGFVGRFAILSNNNIVGLWIDSFCKAPAQCRPQPEFIAGFTSADFIYLMTCVTVGGFVLTLCYRVLFSRWSSKAVSQIYDEVTYRVSRYPQNYFDQTPAGKIITRFSSDYGAIFRMFGGPLAEFMAIIFDLILTAVLIYLASPWLVGFIFAFAGANFLVYKANQNKLREARRELSAARSPSVSHFAETIQGSVVVRTFNRVTPFLQRFSTLDQMYLTIKLATLKKVTFFSIQMNVISAFLFLVTGICSVVLIDRGLVTIGSVGVTFGLIIFSSQSITMFFEFFSQFEEAMVGVERLNKLLLNPIEYGSYLPVAAQFKTSHPRKYDSPPSFLPASSQVEIKNLNFKYDSSHKNILEDINLVISAKEKLGIVGRTGSGKSTLIQCLLYLYRFDGTISVDGRAPNLDLATDFTVKDYRKYFSVITQEPVIFRGTLRENLIQGEEFVSDESLERTLNLVGLGHFWLDQFIEEKGKNLSQGEKQLICMARCLIHDTPVVIFDEATANVDPQSEELMVKASEQILKDRTSIVIAHRLSTLEKCDRILWLEDGRIKKIGPASEILKELSNNV